MLQKDEISREAQNWIAIFLCVILAIGLCGNLMTIIVIALNRKLQTVPNL